MPSLAMVLHRHKIALPLLENQMSGFISLHTALSKRCQLMETAAGDKGQTFTNSRQIWLNIESWR